MAYLISGICGYFAFKFFGTEARRAETKKKWDKFKNDNFNQEQ